MVVAAGIALSILLIVVPITYMRRFGRDTSAAAGHPMSTAPGAPLGIRMAPDGSQWWDGAAWVPSRSAAPPGALWSPDGQSWYDGLEWHDARPGAA